MMDKIEKFLAKLSASEKSILRSILLLIKKSDFTRLDVKRLKGQSDIFRVRKGKFRIIYYQSNSTIKILSLERRSDNTYNLK
ncbi:hypothetical protein K9M09_01855 [Patescibacteria group bacterium]|nr:hypothetical protein [Patescibacteria group bacterium]